MAGRLYRMAKVVSANPASWGIVDANQISGFRTVATQANLYSIAACILSSAYGDGTTTGADAVGQIWHVQDTNKDFRLTSWANRGKAAGWEEVLYADSVYSKSEIDGKINTINTSISSKADNATVIGLSTKVNDIESTVSTHTQNITDINTKLSKKAEKDDVSTLMDTIDGITAELTNFKDTVGKKNGLAQLDSKGFVPLSQLGNLDMTVFTVVNALPTSKIENKVYLLSNGTSGDNKYEEYIYTGDRSGTYDASKWERLGSVKASVDMTNYYTKTQTNHEINKHTINSIAFVNKTGSADLQLKLTEAQGTVVDEPTTIPIVNNASDASTNGLMSPTMLTKLNSLTNYTHPTHTAKTSGLYKITVDGLGHVSVATPVKTTDLADLGALTSAPTFRLSQSGGDDYINIEATYNEKTYSTSLVTAGADHPGLMSAAAYTKLESTSNNLSTLTEKVNGIKSFSVNDVVAGEQYSLMATDGTDAFNVGNIFIRTAGNGNTEIEAGGKKTDINAIAAYARYDINGNHIDTTYWKKADLVAISNDELTTILV